MGHKRPINVETMAESATKICWDECGCDKHLHDPEVSMTQPVLKFDGLAKMRGTEEASWQKLDWFHPPAFVDFPHFPTSLIQDSKEESLLSSIPSFLPIFLNAFHSFFLSLLLFYLPIRNTTEVVVMVVVAVVAEVVVVVLANGTNPKGKWWPNQIASNLVCVPDAN